MIEIAFILYQVVQRQQRLLQQQISGNQVQSAGPVAVLTTGGTKTVLTNAANPKTKIMQISAKNLQNIPRINGAKVIFPCDKVKNLLEMYKNLQFYYFY